MEEEGEGRRAKERRKNGRRFLSNNRFCYLTLKKDLWKALLRTYLEAWTHAACPSRWCFVDMKMFMVVCARLEDSQKDVCAAN